MKKLVALLLAMVLTAGVLAGCGEKKPGGETTPTPTTKTEEKKTVVIYCWNEEFQSRFNAYYKDKLPANVDVKWVMTPSKDMAYQDKLDADLQSGQQIDIFLIEADYASKYTKTDYAVDVKQIGLTDKDMSQMYKYTKDIVTDSKGAVKAVSWQATPGLFSYRRDIAKSVLGTDDPVEVQAMLSDWTKFDDVAAKMKKAGYFMLSGYDDAYRVYSNNVSAPWVNANNEIVIDNNIMNWIKQTKTYTDKKYNNGTSLWDPDWQAGQGPKGKVFGYFYSTWGINFTLLGNALANPVPKEMKKYTDEYWNFLKDNGLFGQWAVCEGPASWYWGGTWLCAGKSALTDGNKDIVKDIMYTMTCDSKTAKQITLDIEDYTNNMGAMDQIANDASYGSKFLGGQNHIKLFNANASKIDMSKISPYDQGLNEELQSAMKNYFTGAATLDQAMDTFYKAAIVKYPNLKRPAK